MNIRANLKHGCGIKTPITIIDIRDDENTVYAIFVDENGSIGSCDMTMIEVTDFTILPKKGGA